MSQTFEVIIKNRYGFIGYVSLIRHVKDGENCSGRNRLNLFSLECQETNRFFLLCSEYYLSGGTFFMYKHKVIFNRHVLKSRMARESK
jgi:hypothetical protein